MKDYTTYTTEALNEELEKVEDRIGYIQMADYIRGAEKIEYDRLCRERDNIYIEIRARG